MRKRLLAPTMLPDALVPVIISDAPSAAAPVLKWRRENELMFSDSGVETECGRGCPRAKAYAAPR